MAKTTTSQFSFNQEQLRIQGRDALYPKKRNLNKVPKTKSKSSLLDDSTYKKSSSRSVYPKIKSTFLLTALVASLASPTQALPSPQLSQLPSRPPLLPRYPLGLNTQRRRILSATENDIPKIKKSQQSISKSHGFDNFPKFQFLEKPSFTKSVNALIEEFKKIPKAEIIAFFSSTSAIIDFFKTTKSNNQILAILDLAMNDDDFYKVIFEKLSDQKQNILFLSAFNNNQLITKKIFEILENKIKANKITDEEFYQFVTNLEDPKNNILTALIIKNNTSLIKLILEKLKTLSTPNLDLKFALLLGSSESQDPLNSVHTAINSVKLDSFKTVINHFRYNYESLLTLLNSRNSENCTALFFAVRYYIEEDIIFKAIAEAFHDDPHKQEHLMNIVSVSNYDGDSVMTNASYNGEILLLREIFSVMSNQLSELINLKNAKGYNLLILILLKNNFDYFNELLILLKDKNINLYDILSIPVNNSEENSNLTLLLHCITNLKYDFFGSILTNLQSIDQVILLLNQNLMVKGVPTTPINQACLNKDPKIFDEISSGIERFTSGDEASKIDALEQIFFPSTKGLLPLEIALRNSTPEVLEKILSFFHNFPELLYRQIIHETKNMDPSLIYCIVSNELDKFKIFIENINRYLSKEQAMELFTKFYSSINCNALSMAIYENKLSFVTPMIDMFNDNDDLLYNIFSNTDINGNTPLIQAVINDNYEIFEFLFLKTLDLVERTLDPENIRDLNKINNFSIIKALTLSSQLGNSKITKLILSRIESSPFATLLNKNNLASCISHLIINEDDDAVKKILQFNEKKIGTKLEANIFPTILKGSSSISDDAKVIDQLSFESYSPADITNSHQNLIWYLSFLKNINAQDTPEIFKKVKIFKYTKIEQIVSPETQYATEETTLDSIKKQDIIEPIIIEFENNGVKTKTLLIDFDALNIASKEIHINQNLKTLNEFKLANDLGINELLMRDRLKSKTGKISYNYNIKFSRPSPDKPWNITIFGDFAGADIDLIIKKYTKIWSSYKISFNPIEIKPKIIQEDQLTKAKSADEDPSDKKPMIDLMSKLLILFDEKTADDLKTKLTIKQDLADETSQSFYQKALSFSEYAGFMDKKIADKFSNIKESLVSKESENPNPDLVIQKASPIGNTRAEMENDL